MSTSINGEECGICMLTNSGLWTLICIYVTRTVFSILTPAHVVLCVVKLPSMLICDATHFLHVCERFVVKQFLHNLLSLTTPNLWFCQSLECLA